MMFSSNTEVMGLLPINVTKSRFLSYTGSLSLRWPQRSGIHSLFHSPPAMTSFQLLSCEMQDYIPDCIFPVICPNTVSSFLDTLAISVLPVYALSPPMLIQPKGLTEE